MSDKVKKFSLYVIETLQRKCEIEAFSEEEAIKILEKKYKDSEIILDEKDLTNTEFTDCKYTKKEIDIMNQISVFCENECAECNQCVEDSCVLFRIEKIIENGFYE